MHMTNEKFKEVENWCNKHEGFIRYLMSIKLKENTTFNSKFITQMFNNYSYDFSKLNFTPDEFIEYWYRIVNI